MNKLMSFFENEAGYQQYLTAEKEAAVLLKEEITRETKDLWKTCKFLFWSYMPSFQR